MHFATRRIAWLRRGSTTKARRALSLALAIALVAALLMTPPAAGQEDQALTDPIPDRPVTSGLGLEVEQFATFPESEPTPTPTDPRLMRHAERCGDAPPRRADSRPR
jgi:hypothetical protein